VSDQDMVTMVYQLMREEGWLLGSSTGINVRYEVLPRFSGPP